MNYNFDLVFMNLSKRNAKKSENIFSLICLISFLIILVSNFNAQRIAAPIGPFSYLSFIVRSLIYDVPVYTIVIFTFLKFGQKKTYLMIFIIFLARLLVEFLLLLNYPQTRRIILEFFPVFYPHFQILLALLISIPLIQIVTKLDFARKYSNGALFLYIMLPILIHYLFYDFIAIYIEYSDCCVPPKLILSSYFTEYEFLRMLSSFFASFLIINFIMKKFR